MCGKFLPQLCEKYKMKDVEGNSNLCGLNYLPEKTIGMVESPKKSKGYTYITKNSIDAKELN